MDMKSFICTLSVLSGLVFSSCSESPTAPKNNGNLIANPYFKSGTSPSLDGWKINDTAWVKVVANAPPGTNTWSLWLAPSFGPAPGGNATTYITGQSGKAVYTFSCWERNFGQWYWGFVSLVQIRNNYQVSSINLNMNDTTWASFTLSDTLDMLPTDTLQVTLAAPSLAVIANPSAGAVDTVNAGVCVNQVSLVKSE